MDEMVFGGEFGWDFGKNKNFGVWLGRKVRNKEKKLTWR